MNNLAERLTGSGGMASSADDRLIGRPLSRILQRRTSEDKDKRRSVLLIGMKPVTDEENGGSGVVVSSAGGAAAGGGGDAEAAVVHSGYLTLVYGVGGGAGAKFYCHYQSRGRLFCMISYNQTTASVASNETFRVKLCLRRNEEGDDEGLLFDIIPEEKPPGTVYTFSAPTPSSRRAWLTALGGTDAVLVHDAPPRRSDARHSYLDDVGFEFVEKCVDALESRGLSEEGLYRMVGTQSKVDDLLNLALDPVRSEAVLASVVADSGQEHWETKTITSAVKSYFRNLSEPLLTFDLYDGFMDAVKTDDESERVSKLKSMVSKLPRPNKQMLKTLIQHLERVAANSEVNMMGVQNLAVCFGPTLMRTKRMEVNAAAGGETASAAAAADQLASIMDIKYGNTVVATLVEHWFQILDACEDDDPDSALRPLPSSSPAPAISAALYSSLTVPLYLPKSQANSQSNSPRGSVVELPPQAMLLNKPRAISKPRKAPPPPPADYGGGGDHQEEEDAAVYDQVTRDENVYDDVAEERLDPVGGAQDFGVGRLYEDVVQVGAGSVSSDLVDGIADEATKLSVSAAATDEGDGATARSDSLPNSPTEVDVREDQEVRLSFRPQRPPSPKISKPKFKPPRPPAPNLTLAGGELETAKKEASTISPPPSPSKTIKEVEDSSAGGGAKPKRHKNKKNKPQRPKPPRKSLLPVEEEAAKAETEPMEVIVDEQEDGQAEAPTTAQDAVVLRRAPGIKAKAKGSPKPVRRAPKPPTAAKPGSLASLAPPTIRKSPSAPDISASLEHENAATLQAADASAKAPPPPVPAPRMSLMVVAPAGQEETADEFDLLAKSYL